MTPHETRESVYDTISSYGTLMEVELAHRNALLAIGVLPDTPQRAQLLLAILALRSRHSHMVAQSDSGPALTLLPSSANTILAVPACAGPDSHQQESRP